MQLLTNRYTRKELYWELCRYRRELVGEPMSDRTFRHWRQILKIVPDEQGLYWREDLERLKEAIRRISQGQTLEQIAQIIRS